VRDVAGRGARNVAGRVVVLVTGKRPEREHLRRRAEAGARDAGEVEEIAARVVEFGDDVAGHVQARVTIVDRHRSVRDARAVLDERANHVQVRGGRQVVDGAAKEAQAATRSRVALGSSILLAVGGERPGGGESDGSERGELSEQSYIDHLRISFAAPKCRARRQPSDDRRYSNSRHYGYTAPARMSNANSLMIASRVPEQPSLRHTRRKCVRIVE